jgi:hypothetical protein
VKMISAHRTRTQSVPGRCRQIHAYTRRPPPFFDRGQYSGD